MKSLHNMPTCKRTAISSFYSNGRPSCSSMRACWCRLCAKDPQGGCTQMHKNQGVIWEHRLCLTRDAGSDYTPQEHAIGRIGHASHGNAGASLRPLVVAKGPCMKQVCVIDRVGWVGENFLPCGHNVCACTSDQDCNAMPSHVRCHHENFQTHSCKTILFFLRRLKKSKHHMFILTLDSEINRNPERTTGLFLSQMT